MQDFTTEALVQYLYNELEPELVPALEAELQVNWALREKLTTLKEVQNRLYKMPLVVPASAVLERIFATAHQLQTV